MTLAHLLAAIDPPDDSGQHGGGNSRNDTAPTPPSVGADAALLARLRAGDELAFDTLMLDHAAALVAFGVTLLGTRDAAEDVVQDLFLWLWDRRETFTLS